MKQKLFFLLTAMMLSLLPFAARSANVISMTTSRAVGSTISLYMEATGSVSITGVTGNLTLGSTATYTLTSKTVTITGDVTKLWCGYDGLTSLDVSHNGVLTDLTCDVNNLTSLDITSNPNLQKLSVRDNQLTSLDLKYAKHLKLLNCSYNKFTSLDLTSARALATLYCYDNKFSVNEMQNVVNTLVDRAISTEKGNIYLIDKESATEGNQVTGTHTFAAGSRGWTARDASGLEYPFVIKLTTTAAIGKQITLSINGDGVVVTGATRVGTFVQGQRTNYTLSSQTVTIKGDVSALGCICDLLTDIEINNSMLKSLNCNTNNLETLDLHNNEKLETLNCSKNKLTTLNLFQNSSLRTLDISGNLISRTAMKSLVKSLPNFSKESVKGECIAYAYGENSDFQDNDITPSQAQLAQACGWNLKTSDGESLSTMPYISLNTTKAVGSAFRSKIVTSSTKAVLSGIKGVYKYNEAVNYTTTAQDIYVYGNVTYLYCPSLELTDIKVDKANMLTELYCNNNSLESLNVNNNTRLQSMACNGNKIKSLDLTQNTMLGYLWCYDNQLSGAKMDALIKSLPDRSAQSTKGSFHCINLKGTTEGNVVTTTQVADAKARGWTALDTDGNAVVGTTPYSITLTTSRKIGSEMSIGITSDGNYTVTGIASGKLTSHTITIWGNVTSLDCEGNDILTLETYHDPVLKKLFCAHNSLTDLDVSMNTALTLLDCHENYLTKLDVSKNTALTGLAIWCNSIRDKRMADLVNSLADLTKIPTYGSFDSFNSFPLRGEENNEISATLIDLAKSRGWKCLDASDGTAYAGARLVSNGFRFHTTLPVGSKIKLKVKTSDGNLWYHTGATGTFKNNETVEYTLTSQDVDITGKVTEVDCSGCGIDTLNMVWATYLEVLTCNDNNLKQLNLNYCHALNFLSCKNNPALQTLDLTENPALKTLYCDGNSKLRSLKLGNNPALYLFTCNKCNLSSLDLSHCPSLIICSLADNRLSSLDFSQSWNLWGMACYGNQIKGDKMDALIASMTDRSETGLPGTFQGINPSNTAEGNVITTKQVAAALARGWNVYNPTNEAYAGSNASTNVITMTTDYAVGKALTVKPIVTGDLTIGGGTVLSQDSLSTVIKTTSKTLTFTGDISIFDCSECNLTTLDLSQNLLLERVLCDNNALTTLDLSHNPQLNVLTCYCNNISGDDMDKLIASLPDRSATRERGSLWGIDTNSIWEHNIITPAQVAAALARGWNVLSSNGRYYYGSEPTGISEVQTSDDTVPVAIYDLSGRRIEQMQHGMNIVRMSNGQTKKVMVK